MTSSSHAGRVAVVTGASRGIGRAVALDLARQGAHVVAISRTTGGLEELDDEIRAVGGHATLVPLDLKDGKAIDALGAALYERFGRVDSLVGNAAVLGVLSPVAHLDDKVWDEVMAINVNANWRLIRTLEPLLKQSPTGRAVFLTSGVARAMRAYWGVYSVSKAALECMVGTWAAELRITNVKANVLSPGPIRTAMRARAMPGEDPMTLTPPEDLAPFITAMVAPDYEQTGMLYDFRAKTLIPIATGG